MLINYEEVNSYNAKASYSVSLGVDSRKSLANKIREGAKLVYEKLNEVPRINESDNPQKVYIPTLRGLRPIDESKTDYYLERTRFDYFKHQINGAAKELESAQKNPEVFTGLSLFNELTKLLLGDAIEREKISDYQNFIGRTLFENNKVTLIPKPNEKVLVVKIGSEKERPIYDLGDGIQSAIILTFLPFIRGDKPTFFFIEEPEIYLHPGLQRKILKFYSSEECKNHTFFMTTHSNHFLDITIDFKDVSIFTFRKILEDKETEKTPNSVKELTPNFTVEAVDSGHESSLELLGVRNSSVFLVNATIWVEGITDRWYFREMLKSYMEYLKKNDNLPLNLEEDVHYSFVEYGGANITHWSFLDSNKPQIEVKRLCARALLIIDKDGDSKQDRKKALREKMKSNLIELPCQEIENLLPYEIIKDYVFSREKNPKLVLPEFEFKDYQNRYLGEFIETEILQEKSSKKYKADSGTLKYKIQFCEKALEKIKYESLPKPTQNIVKKIYQFILEQNTKL